METTTKRTWILAAVIAVILLVSFSLCGCKPSDMDQTTYDLGQQAVSVGDGYVNGSTSSLDAYDKLDSIYQQLDAYVPEHSSKHLLVKSDVLLMKTEVDPLIGAAAAGVSNEKFKKELNELKQDL